MEIEPDPDEEEVNFQIKESPEGDWNLNLKYLFYKPQH